LSRCCKQSRRCRQAGAQSESTSKKITSVLHGSSSSRIDGPTVHSCSMTLVRTETHSQAKATFRSWLYRSRKEGINQMRRMPKETVCGKKAEGGPLSRLHAATGRASRNLEVVPTTTTPVGILVTAGTTFLATLSLSPLAQSVWHDGDSAAAVTSATSW
jgi:hypothetical protein